MARLLAPDGQLTTTDTVLYEVPEATEAVVLSGHVVNITSASIATVTIYKRNTEAGTSRVLLNVLLQAGDRFSIAGLTLEAFGQIRGSATLNSVVDWVLSIREQETE